MKFIDEFKAFALKGNVMDMAVGVIIGGAFGKIVTSVVNNVIMPPIGVITGGVDFTDLKCVIKEAEGEAEYMRLLAEAYDSKDKQEFYEFTLALDALKSSLNGNDKTVILDANSDLAKILMGAAGGR